MGKAQFVGSGSFAAEVETAQGAVVVDFTATWCPPCKQLAPVFDRVAEQYEGKVKFVKVDVDESPDVAAKYGVSSIPNLLYFKDGQVVDQSIGYLNDSALSSKVANLVSKN